jgi:ABC-type cobalt transport system substrate-binding protein
LLFFSLGPLAFSSEEKWVGVDESVVEKMAKEYGREAREPLINTDQGDLLLFLFLLAGSIGGFVCGYYWRVIMEKKTLIPSSRYNGE